MFTCVFLCLINLLITGTKIGMNLMTSIRSSFVSHYVLSIGYPSLTSTTLSLFTFTSHGITLLLWCSSRQRTLTFLPSTLILSLIQSLTDTPQRSLPHALLQYCIFTLLDAPTLSLPDEYRAFSDNIMCLNLRCV